MNAKKRDVSPDGRPIADVTVVVPVYNRREIVVRTLDSIMAQTRLPRKLVLVDNNSSDGSQLELERWAKANRGKGVGIVVCQENKPGACAARNRGLKEADTEYTLFFDSDDTMRPHMIERVSSEFGKHPEADILFWKASFNRGGKERILKYRRTDIFVNHIHHGLLSTQRMAARTELFRSCGGWNENVKIWNDWELGVRLLLNARDVKALPEVLVDVYFQPESITGESFSSRFGRQEEAVAAVVRSLGRAGASQRLIANAVMRYAILAGNYAREGNPDMAASTLHEAMASPGLGRRQRLMMKCAYQWTAAGLRGAADIFGRFL